MNVKQVPIVESWSSMMIAQLKKAGTKEKLLL